MRWNSCFRSGGNRWGSAEERAPSPPRPVSARERARSAVTKRIRADIARIAAFNSELGAHLAATIVTGQVCSYQPDRDTAVNWDL